LLLAIGASGQEAYCETPTLSSLKGQARIQTNRKFITLQPAAAALPQVLPRNRYLTISYTIGDPNDPSRSDLIKDTIAALGDALPAALGNSDGSYIVTIRISDAMGNNLISNSFVSVVKTEDLPFL
jgi:hypothetical protein